MPRITTITCALSGTQTEPDDVLGEEADFDLPAGWIEITVRRIEPNPDYEPRLMGAAKALHAQQYGRAKKGEEVPSVADVAEQIRNHPDEFEALKLPDQLGLNEWTEYLAPEPGVDAMRALAALGLDLSDFGIPAGGAQ